MTLRPRLTRGQRAETLVQVVILLAIGGCAAAASFTHVHNVAEAHGQPGWLAWADAVVLELMSIATGLEIRRRHRTSQPTVFVIWTLCAAVALSLSAQVVEAERSAIGWLAAALPALGFLACVKIVLTRGPGPSLARTEVDQVLPVPPSVLTSPSAARPERLTTVASSQDGRDAAQVGGDLIPMATGLADAARQAASAHRSETGRDITRDQLRAVLRVSTDTATDLLRQVRTENKPSSSSLVPVPPEAFTRVNGSQIAEASRGGAR
jgi:hypothetical protein